MTNQVTCRCSAFAFPHRQGCKGCEHSEDRQAEAREPDSLQSLGLVGVFTPDNSTPLRFGNTTQ